MTEPARLWSGENGRRASTTGRRRGRRQVEPPAPRGRCPRPGRGSSRPPAVARGRLRAARPGRWPRPLLVAAAWRWPALTGRSRPTRPAPRHRCRPPAAARRRGRTPGSVYAAVADGVVAVQAGGGSGTGFVIDRRARSSRTRTWWASRARQPSASATTARRVHAEVLGCDPSTDLAALRIDPATSEPCATRPGRLRAVSVGDAVVAMGIRSASTAPPLRASSPGSAARSRRRTASRSTR